jgi:hypothetical protein
MKVPLLIAGSLAPRGADIHQLQIGVGGGI